jgi:hypothetical protein
MLVKFYTRFVNINIITNDIDAYAPVAIIPLQTSAVDSNERKLSLSGEGLIIREYKGIIHCRSPVMHSCPIHGKT